RRGRSGARLGARTAAACLRGAARRAIAGRTGRATHGGAERSDPLSSMSCAAYPTQRTAASSSSINAPCGPKRMPRPSILPRRGISVVSVNIAESVGAARHPAADLLALTARLDALLHDLVMLPLARRRTVPAGIGARPVGVLGVGAAASHQRGRQG